MRSAALGARHVERGFRARTVRSRLSRRRADGRRGFNWRRCNEHGDQIRPRARDREPTEAPLHRENRGWSYARARRHVRQGRLDPKTMCARRSWRSPTRPGGRAKWIQDDAATRGSARLGDRHGSDTPLPKFREKHNIMLVVAGGRSREILRLLAKLGGTAPWARSW